MANPSNDAKARRRSADRNAGEPSDGLSPVKPSPRYDLDVAALDAKLVTFRERFDGYEAMGAMDVLRSLVRRRLREKRLRIAGHLAHVNEVGHSIAQALLNDEVDASNINAVHSLIDLESARLVVARKASQGRRQAVEVPKQINRPQHDIQDTTLAIHGKKTLKSIKLSRDIATQLITRLQEDGLSEADSANLARRSVEDLPPSISEAFNFQDPQQMSAAVELLRTGIRAGGATGQFNLEAQASLPTTAPEKWSERDRRKGENAIEFLNRVWGPWIKAGVLYQDDIRRLGDDKLVRGVRSYCQKHPETKASDVLPPPRRVALERALANANPDSVEASALRTRLAMRASGRRAARKRREREAPHP